MIDLHLYISTFTNMHFHVQRDGLCDCPLYIVVFIFRAIRLTLNSVTPQAISELTYLAQCAGFDYVSRPEADSVWACVKRESNRGAVVVPFLESYLLAVDPPYTDEFEDYDYPEELEDELLKTNLFDSYDDKRNKLSANFHVKEFKHSVFRYFRLEPRLVFCLQSARDYLKKPIHILQNSAYKPTPINIVNIEDRHPEELYRHQAGQAVLIRLNNGEKQEQIELAKHLMKGCAEDLMLSQRGVGIGLREDHMYFDVRPFVNHSSGIFINLWNVEEPENEQEMWGRNRTMHEQMAELEILKYQLENGN